MTRLTLADLAEQVALTDPQLSPDGARVALLAARPDFAENRWRHEILSVDTATGEITRWSTLPGVRHPRWAPAGALSFLAPDDENTPQVFVSDAPAAEPRRLTGAPRGVSRFAWRPGSSDLAYVTEATPPPPDEPHNRSFEVADHAYLATAPTPPAHLWLRTSDGSTRSLTAGGPGITVSQPVPGDSRPFDWAPDGSSVVVLTQRETASGAMMRLALERIDVESGMRTVLVAGPLALANPRVSPDGAWVAYGAPAGDEPLFTPNGVFVVALQGGTPRLASRHLDRDLAATWLPDGTLLARGWDKTRIRLWRLPVDGLPELVPTGEADPISSPTVAGSAIAFVGSTPGSPQELYVLDRVVTAMNAGWSARTLGAVEEVAYEGGDGSEQTAVLVKPPDFDPTRHYPLVLSLHGGPMATATRGFNPLAQLLAAEGWLVLAPNYRGSNNAGLRFQRAIVGDPAEGPTADILAAMATVQARGIVDDARIAVVGWSYGGYLTAWMTAHDDRWRAAVAGAPVLDWLDAYCLSDVNVTFGDGLGGSPFRNGLFATYSAQSPIAHAHRIRTPTLILACTGDERVPITHAYKLYRALRENGVPVRFVAYPVSGHAPHDPVHARDVQRRWVDWLREHLR